MLVNNSVQDPECCFPVVPLESHRQGTARDGHSSDLTPNHCLFSLRLLHMMGRTQALLLSRQLSGCRYSAVFACCLDLQSSCLSTGQVSAQGCWARLLPLDLTRRVAAKHGTDGQGLLVFRENGARDGLGTVSSFRLQGEWRLSSAIS